jgi:hypothetical protein
MSEKIFLQIESSKRKEIAKLVDFLGGMVFKRGKPPVHSNGIVLTGMTVEFNKDSPIKLSIELTDLDKYKRGFDGE